MCTHDFVVARATRLAELAKRKGMAEVNEKPGHERSTLQLSSSPQQNGRGQLTPTTNMNWLQRL